MIPIEELEVLFSKVLRYVVDAQSDDLCRLIYMLSVMAVGVIPLAKSPEALLDLFLDDVEDGVNKFLGHELCDCVECAAECIGATFINGPETKQ